jgi:hypothetical protein
MRASMNFAERARLALAGLLLASLAACGGSSTETRLVGGGLGGGTAAEAHLDIPTGDNTTQIVVDAGPQGGFSFGAVNVPYVSVSVCAPGSATNCVAIDHVFLDTGSIGLRVFASTVARLGLPAVQVPADTATATPAGAAVECYPFVLGAVWGGVARADVRIAGELASGLPIQLIDDAGTPADAVPADCKAAANGQLMNTAAALQANGILGIGMLAYDCGQACVGGNYASGYTLYYACPAGSACSPAAIPAALQVQNPVTFFPVDNNGTIVALPALPPLGAQAITGRLVFGIGTRSNNQLPATPSIVFVDANPSDAAYLYFSTTVGATTYTDSYIDSGSNALFFDDASVSQTCQSNSGSASGTGAWYCPSSALQRTATLTDARGDTTSVAYTVASADALFNTSGIGFDDLGGTLAPGSRSFVWGLPFFYGRSVYTSIWGQTLSSAGPWNAF